MGRVLEGDTSVMRVTAIKQNEPEALTFTWDDGLVAPIPLKRLRDTCPCAGCQGETVLLHTYAPQEQPILPGRYEIARIIPVGTYAIQLVWKDGHDTGLYPWEYLRAMCECPR
jgi:DUF971 family protein